MYKCREDLGLERGVCESETSTCIVSSMIIVIILFLL